MKFYKIIIVLILILLVSCVNPPQEDACSKETPWGVCSSETDFCYEGVCIGNDEQCGKRYAPCDKKLICVQKEDSQEYECVKPLCDLRHKTGRCENSNETCINGICMAPCASDNLEGFCEGITFCLDGVCENKCVGDQEGKCSNDQKCVGDLQDKDQEDDPDKFIYHCKTRCSPSYPTGVCDDGKICSDFGNCYDPENECSTEKPDGDCQDPEKICIAGACEFQCEKIEYGGRCKDEDKICVNRVCEFKCSSDHRDGICDKSYMNCVAGVCKKQCSDIEPNGYCNIEGEVCSNSECTAACSIDNLSGACEDLDQTCKNGTCLFLCSRVHTDGICENNKDCINGICSDRCSAEAPNGACDDPLRECLVGECFCTNGEDDNGDCFDNNPCSPNLCTDTNRRNCIIAEDSDLGYECLCDRYYILSDGICKRQCSPTEPNGVCPRGSHCENGDCASDSSVCADERPKTHITGACCSRNSECTDGFNTFGMIDAPTNICIDDNNPAGNYCIGVKMEDGDGNPFFQNDPNACHTDADCSDPYPDKGEEEDYFCNQLFWEYPPYNLKFSFCQRIYNNCERDHRGEGESCDDTCHDVQCAKGLHCVENICTPQCETDSDCANNSVSKNCLPFSYNIPGTTRFVEMNLCLNECSSNSDCLRENEECNADIAKYRSDNNPIPSLETLYCRGEQDGTVLKGSCRDDTECKSKFCNREDYVCTTPCDDDGDCDAGYCHYNLNFNREKGDASFDLNYMGVCIYTTPNSSLNQCHKRSDCPNSEYCLPRFKDEPIFSGDGFDRYNSSVTGVCAIKTDNKRVLNINQDCEGSNEDSTSYCATGLCICNDEVCTNGLRGACREYCETTSDCPSGNFCKRVKVRDSSEYNKDLYAGICISNNDTSSFNYCDENSCSNGETCIYNMVNKREDSSRLNKFSSEYICRTLGVGANVSETCHTNDDCSTHICNCSGVECATDGTQTGKCSVACRSNSDCTAYGVSCNEEFTVISDFNQANVVNAKVCDIR